MMLAESLNLVEGSATTDTLAAMIFALLAHARLRALASAIPSAWSALYIKLFWSQLNVPSLQRFSLPL